ncbi:ABC transporter ATP-binding protein [Oceanicola sp. 22II-s10i]|uniref:ABC transporter ATP-binding protein n=1 Tax=Oceanicola sp. 22II-s10i TaxID=1317116 RepID=UPI000B520F06|nr:ABC transporter ATP-binding protein [Oceanicola sp. 22II-s10i]
MTDNAYVARVENLEVKFVSRESTTKAVNGVSFTLKEGEVLSIIGESGSGKSVSMRALMRLLPSKAKIGGEVEVNGKDVLKMSGRELTRMRGKEVSMIFQEPMTALDPVYTVGDQIAETVMRHEGVSKEEGLKRALELLEFVRVPSAERRLKAYPFELSGGLRQRAMIAMALSCRPSLLLADEPTTALDATVQIQVLILLRKLQKEMGMGVIFVTHDLGVAAQIADKVAVMYAGRIVEMGPVRDLLRNPLHPYTQGMLASTVHGQDRNTDIEAIPGSPPDMRNEIRGCAFAPRCKHATELCRTTEPPETSPGEGRAVRCHLVSGMTGAEQDAPAYA